MARDNIDVAIRAAILGVPGVPELLGTRLYADDAVPQEESFPYGVITMIGDATRYRSLNGGAMPTLNGRYQVDFYALTKSDARMLRNKVTARAQENGLDGFRGTCGGGDEAAYVQQCAVENRRNIAFLLEEGSETYVYNAGFDLLVTFNE